MADSETLRKEKIMIALYILARDGRVIPVYYTKESQLQLNAEKYQDVIFFYN